MTVLIITGTDTGVGKTIATAALASHARQTGLDVAVCKPAQTGTVAGDDDLADVRRLTGLTNLVGLARYPEPMAPVAAAEQAGLPLPDRDDVVGLVRGLDRPGRLTLVEGAGGVLVELTDGLTVRDLAAELHAPVLVVARAELGTLNHSALTLEALATHGLNCAGLVIGSWPVQPDAVQTRNRQDLNRLQPVRAVLPAAAGALDAPQFAAMSAAVFDRDWVMALVA